MKICLSCEGVTSTTAQRCGHCGAWLLPTDSVHYPDRRGEQDAGNPLLGTVIDGKYRLQGVLGRGGLGTVFQAVHIGSLMPVAVKLLHPRFSERPEYRRALLPEARRAATITNEHCSRMLDVGESEDGVAYLAMELVSGETLDVLVRRAPLAPSHAVLVLLQVAEALVAIHAAGLVHCDLSPRNVMVAVRDGQLHVKVLDFGIARTATMAGAERTTGGEFAGFVNAAFAAPEHLAGQDIDARADLFSFGMLAWYLLVGALPIDDADPVRAARAIVKGELRPWPNVPGVPRRLQRLILACLRSDRQARPASAEAVVRELDLVYALRRPALGTASVLALAAAAMAAIVATLDLSPPFLGATGSALELASRLPPGTLGVQYLRSEQLGTLQLHFGGFRAERLCVDVTRGGTRLLRAPLRPEVDAGGDTLILDTAQAQWRDLLQSLLSSSREKAIDLSFVVPGTAPLGHARVRLDDEPPHVQWSIESERDDVLAAGSRVVWQAGDAIALDKVLVQVAWSDGRRHDFALEGESGGFALGERLAASILPGGDLGPCQVSVWAVDRAGNTSARAPRQLPHSDVRAPEVVEVTGAGGETSYVPCIGGRAQLRVRVSADEPDCTLRIEHTSGREHVAVPLPHPGLWHLIDVPIDGGEQPLVSGPVDFAVVDARGNRSVRQFVLNLQVRDLRLEFVGEGPGFVTLGKELVVDTKGAMASFRCTPGYRLARAEVTLTSGTGHRSAPAALRCDIGRTPVLFAFGELPPGSHRLLVELDEVDGESRHRVTQVLALRVLPAVLELRVPAAASRFLPGLLDAGVLARAGNGMSLRDGARWNLDPELVPYVRGTLWVGSDNLVPVPLPVAERAGEPLLPEVLPIPGHNLLGVTLRDVLDRPLRVLVGDQPAPRRDHGGRPVDIVADFWWHEGAPEPIGEELLVEHGQPARLQVRMPLPYLASELPELRCGLAQTEIAAAHAAAEGTGSIVTFDLPFAAWSAAAALTDQTREDYAAALQRQFRVSIATPMGSFPLHLRLSTTRSTLRPVTLRELGAVHEPLAALRLLPVLAPAQPFDEPVPRLGPPRALFRPQEAVTIDNLGDLLLQDREFTCGEAQALLLLAAPLLDGAAQDRLVHADDPLGARRLAAEALLPQHAATAPTDRPLTGVDFFQAYALCRLLGLVLAGDPELFRLPFGCELELAAFRAPVQPACNGPAAAGRAVAMPAFRAAAERLLRGEPATAEQCRAAGDRVAAESGAEFLGLDFGVREWVSDLPHVPGAEPLLAEWLRNHAGQVQRVAAFSSGAAVPPGELGVALRTFGVVRGLPLGELDGLLAESGQRLDARLLAEVPGSVPGVLRTEQLRRDGRDLLSTGPDPRLPRIGFRVAGTAALLARLRGQR